LANYLAQSLNTKLVECRANKNFSGLSGFINLWKYAFSCAKGSTNFTVQRLFLPVLLASILRDKKVVVVLHHYDKNEQNSLFYHLNFKLMLYLLCLNLTKFKVVVVADYWRSWLVEQGVNQDSIYTIPNLFDDEVYKSVKASTHKQQQVYLGQYGVKQHPMVFELAETLTQHGLTCFFTTPYEGAAKTFPTYSIKHLPFDDYLKEIAASLYTVCISSFNEGWNRTAHESLLLGTPVIGNKVGGLGQLLGEAQQPIVSTKEEVIALILQKQNIHIPQEFLMRYHINQILYYAKPLEAYCSDGIG